MRSSPPSRARQRPLATQTCQRIRRLRSAGISPTPPVSKTSTATRSSASSRSTIIVDSEPFGHAHPAAPPSCKRALGAPRPERRGGPSATDSASGSQHRSRRRRRTFVLGVLVPLTIAAGAVALSNVGGTGAPATIQRSSGRPTAETTPFVSTKTFGTLTALFVAQAQRLARADVSSAVHRRRKPRTRKPKASRRVTRKPPATHQTPATQQMPSTPVASPTTASSVASSSTSSSSAAAASTQSASSETARAASSQQSRPAFGQNGTLGPGRGASGTQ